MPDGLAATPNNAHADIPPALPDAPVTPLRWDAIERSTLNPRKHFDPAEVEALADAIAAQGLLQNLVVRPHPDKKKAGRYELIGGERRHRAIEHLIKTNRVDAARPWPARIVPCEDREALSMALAENVARRDLTPLEEAEAFKRLIEMKTPKEAIARAAGASIRHVELRLRLLNALAPKALTALKDGKITLEHARELTKAPAKRQDSILERIVPPGTKVDDPDDGYGHGAIVTAEELRAELRRDSVPADQAVFDEALYKGARFIDPDDGTTYFEDIDEFEKLQAAAIEAKRKELAEKNGGRVEVLENWRARSLAEGKLEWPWEKMRKGQEGQAYVLLAVVDGKFIIKEGVVKNNGYGDEPSNARAAQSSPSGGVAPKPEPKPEDIPVGAARQALTVRTHAIQAAIAADGANGATHAKRLFAFAWLADDGIVRFSRQDRGAITRAPAVEKLLADFAKLGLRDDALDTEKMWGRIVALPSAQLDKLFAALVAAQFSIESQVANDCWPRDEELAIAASVKADPRITFHLDEDFLAKLKKGQLLRIVADLKLEADPRFAKGSDDLTATVIRKIILDAGAKLKGYVPVWCRFEPEAAMKAQMKATPKIGTREAKATIAKIAGEKPPIKSQPAKPQPAKKPAAKPTPKKKAK